MFTIPYHLGEQNEFSLGYVTPDYDQYRERLSAYDSPTRVRCLTVSTPNQPVYLTYTHTPVDESDVSIPDHPFVQTMLRAFAGVVDGRRSAEDAVHGSKSVSLEDVPEILSSRINWRQPVPAVGGQLLSNLILTHALPNANHRTSLSMLVVYLQSVGADVSADALQEADVDAFIQESKRLLTVRRNGTQFRILADCGCTHVERKGGVRIPLHEYELDEPNPYTHFAEAHEAHAIRFVETVVDETWKDEDDPGMRTFLDRL